MTTDLNVVRIGMEDWDVVMGYGQLMEIMSRLGWMTSSEIRGK
jgi:hypothetical protein